MDLHHVDHLLRPATEADLPPARPGDAPLAGGTWLFSEPQPGTDRLVDLLGLGWDEIEATPAGLRVGATVTLAALAGADLPWPAAVRLARFCAASLASADKIQRVATVGGNLCLALPAGAFVAWAVALGGVCVLRSGAAERRVPAAGFVTGDRQTVLRPDELLRAIELPDAALHRAIGFRRAGLTPHGRSGALVVATARGDWAFTITAATVRPVVVRFPAPPDASNLRAALQDALPGSVMHDDVHGDPDWRRARVLALAEEIRVELAG